MAILFLFLWSLWLWKLLMRTMLLSTVKPFKAIDVLCLNYCYLYSDLHFSSIWHIFSSVLFFYLRTLWNPLSSFVFSFASSTNFLMRKKTATLLLKFLLSFSCLQTNHFKFFYPFTSFIYLVLGYTRRLQTAYESISVCYNWRKDNKDQREVLLNIL